MKKRNLAQCVVSAATALTAMALATSVRAAQVVTSDPSLPVVYPAGFYRTPDDVHASFSGSGLTIVLSNIEHRAFAPVTRMNMGPDETEMFNSQMVGLVSINGGAFTPNSAAGPVQTIVFGKVGNVTGTFQTEMLSMNLVGSGFMIRESPTLPSLGVTSITDIGGGLYHIDSFFDVFTELSLDGGQTWMPDQQGPAHVDLCPEPSVYALASLAAVLLALRRTRWFGKQN